MSRFPWRRGCFRALIPNGEDGDVIALRCTCGVMLYVIEYFAGQLLRGIFFRSSQQLDEMFEAINGMMAEVRTKRPDLFLPMGLRKPMPFYTSATDMNTPFPLDTSCYSAFVYYLVGRAEMREDTWSDDGRATAMMNKAVAQLLTIQS